MSHRDNLLVKAAGVKERIPAILFLLFFTLVGFMSCRSGMTEKSPQPYLIEKQIIADRAGIATAHPAASEIGLDILRAGGNAVDAAIATQFALAVCYPVAGNIGGGGFMVIRNADGTTDALDFRETAPSSATRDMYLDSSGHVIEGLSINGHLAAGVPGSVDGMVKAFDKYSKLRNWKKLIQPAIDLAADGVYLTTSEARNLNRSRQRFLDYNTRPTRFVKDGEWSEGDLLVQPELASTLEAIRDHRDGGFYTGWVADSIVAEMRRGGGILTHDDLKSYDAVWRKPVTGTYRGHQIVSMPPPSSGGIALLQLLGSIEPFPVEEYGFHTTQSVHLMIEAERRTYADRATHLGDSDFYPVPIQKLLDRLYLDKRMETFSPSAATPSEAIEAGQFTDRESMQTTHFSIIDEGGNAVAVTTTINTGYGNKVVVGGAGFLLNNEMDDFSAKPGVPNFFGLIGNEANSIVPGKRMLSSMTPTIVAKDGNLKLVVGTPGGSTIITSVFQIIVNVIDFGMGAAEAVSVPRFHHQWLPDQVFLEPECLDSITRQELKVMGHHLIDRAELTGGSGHIGRVEAILATTGGRLEIAADPRGDDSAMGY